jgi:hypothetical protein
MGVTPPSATVIIPFISDVREISYYQYLNIYKSLELPHAKRAQRALLHPPSILTLRSFASLITPLSPVHSYGGNA